MDAPDRIFEEALGLDGKARDQFLATACGENDALRHEVERLLAIDASNGGRSARGDTVAHHLKPLRAASTGHDGAFADCALIQPPPQVIPGQKVGRFIVRREIGRGGMSHVYEAEDPEIERSVALKILSASSTDANDQSRFQELRLLGRMQHDHIVRVYDFGEHGGALYLVMELLQGENLAASIAANRVGPLERRLEISLQIADALRQIHHADIVHRDIKPGNVFIESTGRAKLLDFGIAHHGSKESGGRIIGTPEYLSPEQIRGRATPASDIYSFGVLLFELFTGQKPFTGNDLAEILWRVAFEGLPAEPMRAALLPDSISRLVLSLTAKDAAARPDLEIAIGTLHLALAETREGAVEARVSEPPPSRRVVERLSRVKRIAVAATAISLAVAYSWYSFSQRTDNRRPSTRDAMSVDGSRPHTAAGPTDGSDRRNAIRVENQADPVVLSITIPKQLSFRTIEATELAVSPNGQRVVFRAASADGLRLLWLRNLDSKQLTALPGTDYGRFAFWSPDGSAIGFFAWDKLKRVDIFEGTVQELADAPNSKGGSWNGAGIIIFAPNGGQDGIYAVSAQGGARRKVTTLDRKSEEAHIWPSFLPDGRRFLYAIRGTDTDSSSAGTYIQALDGGDRRRILAVTSNVAYAAEHLLFPNRETLMAVPFSLDEGRRTGEPYVVGTDIRIHNKRTDFSAAGHVLGYWAGDRKHNRVSWFSREGQLLQTQTAPVQLTDPDLSPDGHTIAFSTGKDIWRLDWATGHREHVTQTPSSDYYPVWSPDGNWIVFTSNRQDGMRLQQLDVNTGREISLLSGDRELYPTDWSRDGRYILFEKKDAQTSDRDVWALPTFGDRTPIPVATTPNDERQGQISPDNRWIAYTAIASGRWQVYVTSFQGSERPRQISNSGGVQPKWAAGSSELFYLAPDQRLMVTTISQASGLRFSTPRPLFRVDVANLRPRGLYNVTPDGKQFMFITVPPPDEELINIVTNWSGLRGPRK